MTEQDAPILIIGPPRSGTTLLATMLNAHPHLFVANEAKVFVRLLPRAGNVQTPLSEERAASVLRELERNEMSAHAPLPRAEEMLAGARETTVPEFLRELFRRLAAREGKRRWGEKTAVAYRNLDAIRAAFPDARFLGLDREPEQIADSYERMVPKWGALGGLVHWIDYHRAVARQDATFEIRRVSYGRLVEEPEDTLRGVCAFVGEEYVPEMLQFHRTARARQLSGSPVFSGASRPLYQHSRRSSPGTSGFHGGLMRRLVEVGKHAGATTLQPQLWERVVRCSLWVRASLWEIRQPDFWRRIIRSAHHLAGSGRRTQ